MRHPSAAPGRIDGPHLRVDIGDPPLESGAVLHEARLGTAAILGSPPSAARTMSSIS